MYPLLLESDALAVESDRLVPIPLRLAVIRHKIEVDRQLRTLGLPLGLDSAAYRAAWGDWGFSIVH